MREQEEADVDSSDDVLSSVITLSAIESASPKAAARVRRLNPHSLLGLVGGLLTIPSLQPNTIRIEALGLLAAVRARGNKTLSRCGLGTILNGRFGGTMLASMEDPVEDVFVSNVMTPLGNHRIFEGIWERADFWLQETAFVVSMFSRKSRWAQVLGWHMGGLLKLSDAIAERLGLSRNTVSDGTPKGQINIPSGSIWEKHKRAVRFSKADLVDYDVDESQLLPFILDLPCSVGTTEGLGHSPLERRPLIIDGDEYVFALPTATSPALRRYVLEYVVANGFLGDFQALLDRNQADSVLHDCLRHMSRNPPQLNG